MAPIQPQLGNEISCEKGTQSVTLDMGPSNLNSNSVKCNLICVSGESSSALSAQPEVGLEQLGPGLPEAGQCDLLPDPDTGTGQEEPVSDPGMSGISGPDIGPDQEPVTPLCSTVKCAQESPRQHSSGPASKEKMRIMYKLATSHKRMNFEDRAFHLLAKRNGIAPKCNKVASYKTPLLKQKYIFPKKEFEAKDNEMCLKDERTMLEVLEDCLGVIHDCYEKSELEYISRQIGYDSSIRMFSKTGQPLPQTLLKEMIKSYKEMKGLKSTTKAVQELAAREGKFYTMEDDEVQEFAPDPQVQEFAPDPQVQYLSSGAHLDPASLLMAKKSFIPFIKQHKWLLTSATQKRQFRIYVNRDLYQKNTDGGKIKEFFLKFYILYYNQDLNTWKAPEANPIDFPGNVYLISKGEELKYIPCRAVNVKGEEKILLFLSDSGASHNLIMKTTLEKLGLDVFPIKKKRLHLFTASGEEKDVVEGECTLQLYLLDKDGRKFSFTASFLVVSDKMHIPRPILGMPFLKLQGCKSDWEIDYMSARLTNEHGELKRITLPQYIEKENSPSVSQICSYGNIFQAPVSCFSVSDFTHCSEEDDLGPLHPASLPEPQELRSETEAALELAAQVHLVYPHTKAHQVFTDLGGTGTEVPMAVREELDEQVYREIDLMSALTDAREHRDMGIVDNKFLKLCQPQLNKLQALYPVAFASATRKVGKFKYFQYSPDIIEGSTCKQPIRSQKTMHFKNVQDKIKSLEADGIIGVSADQSTDYVHNMLFLSKRRATEAGRNATKADLHIAGHSHRLTDPDIKIRAINDLSDFNKRCLKSTPTIKLPTQSEVQDFVKGRVCSSFDLTEMFASIELKPSAYKYFNFYLNDLIWSFRRVVQGCSSSPFVATEALRQTFDHRVWEALKSKLEYKLKLLFHYYSSYSEFVKSFMDDILVSSFVICKCQGGHCNKNFFCPTMNFEQTARLHMEAIEALYFAISEAGFLLNPEKTQFFVHSGFVFIGLNYDAVNMTYSIASDRVKSIMSFRTPRSIAETSSRISSLRFSAPFIPFLNKILLPLTQLCQEGNGFHWERRHMQAFNNAKFIVGLCLKKYAYRPDRPALLVSDSSKYSLSYTLYTVGEGGDLRLCETETKIATGPESRLQAVNRELICLVWSIHKTEHYIFSAEKEFIAVGDFASIMYLQANSPHDSRVGQAGIYLSKFTDKLQLTFLPGRHLGLADLFSRQFSNVYLKREDTEISKTLAQNLPPIPNCIKDKIFKMSAEELTDFVFGRINRSHIDIWDHASHVTQKFRLNDFQSLQREFEPIQGLLRFLKDPYNLRNLDYEAMREYFIILRDSTKTKIQAFIKDEKLNHFKDIVDKLDFSSNWKKVFGIRPARAEEDPLAQQAKKPVSVQNVQDFPIELMIKPFCYVNNVTTRQQTRSGDICPIDHSMLVDTNFVSNCKHYKLAISHNGQFPTAHFKRFCENLSHWNEMAGKIEALCQDLHSDISANCRRASDQLLKYKEETCLVSKFFLFREVTALLGCCKPSDWIQIIDPEVQLLPYSINPNSDFQIKECGDHLTICIKDDLYLDGMEMITLKGAAGFLLPSVNIETVAPEPLRVYFQSSQLNVSLINSVSIFNANITPVTVLQNTPLFHVSCENKLEPILAKIEWQHGQDYFDKILSLMSMNAERHICNLFTDYLLSSRERILESSRTQEGGVQAALQGRPRAQSPPGEPGEPDSPGLPGRVTRSRHRLSQSPPPVSPPPEPSASRRRPRRGQTPPGPICTVYTASGLSGSSDILTSQSLLQHASRTFGEGQGNDENSSSKKCKNVNDYHGQNMLSTVLFAHYLRVQGIRQISRTDLIALQNSDHHLIKIRRELELNKTEPGPTLSSLYFLENNILYRQMHIKEHNIIYKTLCLPQFLAKIIVINLHALYDIHISTGQMYLWLRLHLYSYDLMNIIKSARRNCMICEYSTQAKKRALGGTQLMFREMESKGPGSVVFCDLLFLAYNSQLDCNCLLLLVDAVSKHIQIAPCKSKSAASIIQAFTSIFLTSPTPAILCLDAGSEFTADSVTSFLQNLGCEIYYCSSKNSQMAESQVRIYKLYLNKMIQSAGLANNQWGQVAIPALQLLNARPPHRSCVLSRSQIFFSPAHFIPRWYLNVDSGEKDAPNLHLSHLKVLSADRSRYIPKKPLMNMSAQRGCFASLEVPRREQEAVNQSQQLLPSISKLLKIKSVMSGGHTAICKDLLSGDKLRFNTGRLRPLSLSDHYPFPNKSIKIKYLSQLVPAPHGPSTARNLTSLNAPKAFSIDQSEARAELSDQSEGTVALQEAGTPVSILKVKSAKNWQPYHGVLQSTEAGQSQYYGYIRALDTITELSCIGLIPPDWLINLIKQPKNYGGLYGLIESAVSAPVKSSHNRKVKFDSSQGQIGKYKNRMSCCQVTNTHLKQLYSVGNRELSFVNIECLENTQPLDSFEKIQ